LKKIFLILIATFFACSLSNSQNSTSSPYSFYGIGSLNFKGTSENRAMGRISVYNDWINETKKIIKDFSKNIKSEVITLSTFEKKSISKIKAKLINYAS